MTNIASATAPIKSGEASAKTVFSTMPTRSSCTIARTPAMRIIRLRPRSSIQVSAALSTTRMAATARSL